MAQSYAVVTWEGETILTTDDRYEAHHAARGGIVGRIKVIECEHNDASATVSIDDPSMYDWECDWCGHQWLEPRN